MLQLLIDCSSMLADCVLILRIATLCRRYFNSNPDILKEAPGLCGILQRATEAVIKIAEQLLNKRFKVDISGIRPDALLMCPVCETDILFLLPLLLSCYLFLFM